MSDATEATATAECPAKVQEVLDRISEFTLLELSELVSAFEKRFGITAAAPVAMAAMAPGAAAAEAEEDAEPSSFKVVLKGFGDNKIQVIKAVRAVTNLMLKEAKAVVEEVPSTLKEGLSKEEAEKCVASLVEAGAEAEIQPE
ncbi:MAG: 50S ribosomal protein L7/L12 [Candidatus Brocadiaceae bacterium]|nr:50S ribosomal protein L7/L12 [Candidatus Brocadiaceae bacterium]